MKKIISHKIVQGGMGIGVSDWVLARTVSMFGHTGTVSGTYLEGVFAEGLRQGDPGGYFRRALSHFPFPHIAEKVIKEFYVEEGSGESPRGTPSYSITPSNLLISLTICANFVYVWLAKEGHEGRVHINYLEKVSMPHIYAITGAMLAEVDGITMGAGLAFDIPNVINGVMEGEEVSYTLPVIGKNITSYKMSFNPEVFLGGKLDVVKRPEFFPIISSHSLASIFMKKLPRDVHGFMIEVSTAGGHNAPPRTKVVGNDGKVELVYGKKDIVNFAKIADLGLPFWLAGSYASPEKLNQAQEVGATGVQLGSIFALCEESGLRDDLKKKVRRLGFLDKLNIRTDKRISPTGFPFKVVVLDGTISEESVRENRRRMCNKGSLVSLYEKHDEGIGYMCSSESTKRFVDKGGDLEDTKGRGCLCNALCSAAGFITDEPPIVTMGDDISFLKKVMNNSKSSYDVEDVMRYLLS